MLVLICSDISLGYEALHHFYVAFTPPQSNFNRDSDGPPFFWVLWKFNIEAIIFVSLP